MSLTLTAPGDCPSCEARGFAIVADLAAHLIDQHDQTGAAALATARQLFTRSEEARMPIPKERKRKTTGTCGYCKRERPDHTENCRLRLGGASPATKATKRTPITRRHPLPPTTPKAKRTGLVSEIAALGYVAQALEGLDATGRANVLGCVCKLLAIDPTELAA